MRKRSTRATVTTLIVAGALVIALLLAGAILRMHTHDLSFAGAFKSFVSDTFSLK